MKYTSGNSAEALAPGRRFQHPPITIDIGRAAELSGITGNFFDVYENELYAQVLGHPSRPVEPLVALYIAFCRGVRDLSLQSPAFVRLDEATFGAHVYDKDTIRPVSEVYARKPIDEKLSTVGFISEALLQPDIESEGVPVAQWYRANRVSNKNKGLIPYNQEKDIDPNPKDNQMGTGILTPDLEILSPGNDLRYLIEVGEGREDTFVNGLRRGMKYEFDRRKTVTDSTHVDATYGLS